MMFLTILQVKCWTELDFSRRSHNNTLGNTYPALDLGQKYSEVLKNKDREIIKEIKYNIIPK